MRILGDMPTDVKETTGGFRSLGNFDQTMSGLAQSQSFVDRMRKQAQEAELAAQQAQAPATLAKETSKGVLNTLASGPIRAGRTIVEAVGGLFGAEPNRDAANPMAEAYGVTKPMDFMGNELKSGQQRVEEGESMMKVVGETALDAASVLPVGKALQAAKPAAGLLGKAKNAVMDATGITARREAKSEQQAIIDAIDAVYNEPTGKKFLGSANQILSGERSIRPPSIFREQGLTTDERTANLGFRLKDIGLGKDPIDNTNKLARAMTDTEKNLQRAFDGTDPEVQFLADKPGLYQKISDVIESSPEEFRIKESKEMVERVANFAKKIIAAAEDSPRGTRSARTLFDTQAKREFPNAFKEDGFIDTKTPAGHAIDTIRETISRHLYDTAPNGSEIQNLIGREADIYRAMRAVMEKAKAGQGKKTLTQLAKENPALAAIISGLGFYALGSSVGYPARQIIGD